MLQKRKAKWIRSLFGAYKHCTDQGIVRTVGIACQSPIVDKARERTHLDFATTAPSGVTSTSKTGVRMSPGSHLAN
jgi:hypothetical protein